MTGGVAIGLVLAGLQQIRAAEDLDLDFVEIKGDVLLHDDGRRALRRLAATRPGLIQALTSPLPRALGHRVVGPEVEWPGIDACLDTLLETGADLGVRVVTVGCSQARQRPKGWPLTAARGQLLQFLERVVAVVERHDLIAGLEPLAPKETNTVNEVPTAVDLVDAIASERLGIVYDYFHASAVGRSAAADVPLIGSRLVHVQTADLLTRSLPRADAAQRELFLQCAAIGYDSRVAIECDVDGHADGAVARSVDELRRLGVECGLRR